MSRYNMDFDRSPAEMSANETRSEVFRLQWEVQKLGPQIAEVGAELREELAALRREVREGREGHPDVVALAEHIRETQAVAHHARTLVEGLAEARMSGDQAEITSFLWELEQFATGGGLAALIAQIDSPVK